MKFDSDFFKYFGMVALGFFILFVLHKILAMNDRLLQGFVNKNIEGFGENERDRTKLDSEKTLENLAAQNKILKKRLQLPQDRDKLIEQLDEFQDNAQLEEVLLLNLASSEEKLDEKKLKSIADRLDSWKKIGEALERVKL